MASIDGSSSGGTQPKLPQSFYNDTSSALERQEKLRFFYIASVENSLKGDKESGEKRNKFYETVSTVIRVVLALSSIMMPLAVFYLPAWAPWGVGLPLVIGLSVAQWMLTSKIDTYKREKEFVPQFAEFLKHHTVKSLLPIGEGNISPIDERLKSDLLMRDTLQKNHPQTSHRIAKLVDHLDIEVTPFLQQMAAMECANMTQWQQKWATVANLHSEMTMAAREVDAEKFLQKQEEMDAAAFESVYHTVKAAPLADLPTSTVRSYFNSLVSLHRTFLREFNQLEALSKEGLAIYHELPDWWDSFVGEKSKVDGAINEINTALASADQAVVDALNDPWITPDDRQFILYNLIAQSRVHKKRLEAWIADHPQKRQAAIQEQLDTFKANEVLNQKQVRVFSVWLQETLSIFAQKQVIQLTHALPKEILPWVENHPQYRYMTAEELYNKAAEIRENYFLAVSLFTQVPMDAESLAAFETDVMKPLTESLRVGGGIWSGLKTAFTKLPALPFDETLPKENGKLRDRKVEEIHLNRLLKGVDSQMLFTHRVRTYALRMPLYVLFAIEGIFAIYFSTPWLFWGLSALATIGEGISYYIDQRLKAINQKKQALKLQHVLRDQPDIGIVPGTRPRVAMVKDIQRKYGLEGVRPTWARILAEDADTQFEPLEAIIKEGNENATSYLEDVLISLYSRLSTEGNPEEQEALRKRIGEIETVLQPHEVDKTPEEELLEKARKATIQEKRDAYASRMEIEKSLKQLSEQAIQANITQALLKYKIGLFDRLIPSLPQEMFQNMLTEEAIAQYLLTLPTEKAKADAVDALRLLLILQSDEECPTRELLIEKEAGYLELAASIQDDRNSLLASYSKETQRSTYELLVKERQMVDAMLDKVVDEQASSMQFQKDLEQKARTFNQLYQTLGPQLFETPVMQSEIDLLLITLKMEPLEAPQEPIDLPSLWFETKKSLQLFNRLPDSAALKLLKEEEYSRLLSVPAEIRLQWVKNLRKLQVLQVDPDYQTLAHVNDRLSAFKLKWQEMEQARLVLREQYKAIVAEIQKL